MTEQQTHPPRPWDYWRSPIEGLFRIREPFGDNRRIVGHVMREDDARLIVAAPDMLAALREAEQELTDIFRMPMMSGQISCIEKIRAAIAKAEGVVEGASVGETK